MARARFSAAASQRSIWLATICLVTVLLRRSSASCTAWSWPSQDESARPTTSSSRSASRASSRVERKASIRSGGRSRNELHRVGDQGLPTVCSGGGQPPGRGIQRFEQLVARWNRPVRVSFSVEGIEKSRLPDIGVADQGDSPAVLPALPRPPAMIRKLIDLLLETGDVATDGAAIPR